MYVRHLNDDKLDNRLANLAYGTPEQNHADSIQNGSRRNPDSPDCINGHPWRPETTYTYPNGNRDCILCRREAKRRYRGRKKALATCAS